MAAANGGYFPTEWGWSAIGFLLVAGTALVVLDRLELGRLELAALAGLTAFAGWVALSTAWSPGAGQPVVESERALVYVLALAAVLLVTGRSAVPALAAGVLAATTTIAAYALATRLAPGDIGSYVPGQGYQLSTPLGYWNALGILVAMGILVAVGFAVHARALAARSAAAAALVLLVPTLYFTFSRGASLALAVGMAVTLALDPRRLRLATALLALAPAPGLAVVLASRSHALTSTGAPLETAARQGHRLGLAVIVLALAQLAVPIALARTESRFPPGARARRLWAGALLAAAAALLLAVFVREGSPPTLVHRAVDAFRAPLRPTGGDLNHRLASLSGNGRSAYWRVALNQYEEHPWLGSGAGSYERFWLRDRPVAFYARDAHNLYLEALAELGPLGLVLLVAGLAPPLAAAVRARGNPQVAAVAGAYAAYLAHAGIDWDWEMTGVTLPALFCGAAVLAAARPEAAERAVSGLVRVGALAVVLPLAAWIFVLQIGNSALGAAQNAADRGQFARAAAKARRAERWAPWSKEPIEQLGEAQLALGDLAAARATFRRALARDRGDWGVWFQLALASQGRERRRALAQARRLDPLSPEIAQLRSSE